MGWVPALSSWVVCTTYATIPRPLLRPASAVLINYVAELVAAPADRRTQLPLPRQGRSLLCRGSGIVMTLLMALPGSLAQHSKQDNEGDGAARGCRVLVVGPVPGIKTIFLARLDVSARVPGRTIRPVTISTPSPHYQTHQI